MGITSVVRKATAAAAILLAASCHNIPTQDDVEAVDGKADNALDRAEEIGGHTDALDGRVDKLEKRMNDLETRIPY